jgi:hypothetical protein
MSLEAKPRLDAALLTIKGEASAEPVRATPADGIAALSKRRRPIVTFTYRMDPDRHRRLRDMAHENETSIQAILDHALKVIGL